MPPTRVRVRKTGGSSENCSSSGINVQAKTAKEKLAKNDLNLKVPQIRLRRLSSEELPPLEVGSRKSVFLLSKSTLLKSKSSKGQFSCYICFKSFAGYSSLYNHVRFMHLNPNSFKCSICHQSFNFKYLLNHHIQIWHKNTRLYNCKKCDFSSNYKKSFKNHTQKCGGENNAPKVSRMSFGNRSKQASLTSIQRNGSNVSNLAELTCPMCKITCLGRSALFAHLKRHKNSSKLPNDSLQQSQQPNSSPDKQKSNSHNIRDVEDGKCYEGHLTNHDNNGSATVSKPAERDHKIGGEMNKQTANQKFSERIKNRKRWKPSCSCCADQHEQKPPKPVKANFSEKSESNRHSRPRKSQDFSYVIDLDLNPYVRVKKLSDELILKLKNSLKCKDEVNEKSENLLTLGLAKPCKEEFSDKSIRCKQKSKQSVQVLSIDNKMSSENCSSKIQTEINAYKLRANESLPDRKIENGRVLFTCQHCNKMFKRKIYLKNHIGWFHKGKISKKYTPNQIENAPLQSVNTPTQIENIPTQTENTPTQIENTPTQIENTPTQIENAPIQIENTPTQIENTPTQIENTPTQIENTPTQVENTPIKVENASVQIESSAIKVENSPVHGEKADVIVVKSEFTVEYENQCHLCFVTCWDVNALVNHLKRHE